MRVYIAFVMDNASRNVTRVVPLPARARGGDRNRRRDESRRTPFELFFVSSRRPVGVSPRADDSVARECVRDHSFVLTTCVHVNSVSTFARRPSYRRRQMVVCSTPLTEALAVALEFPKPSRRSSTKRRTRSSRSFSSRLRLDHLGPRDDVYVAVRALLLEVHEPVRL